MNVCFEKDAYFEAVKKDVDYAKSQQQFSYGNVTFRDFKNEYATKEGWFGRKVIALPAVLWSGAVKTIYHLAKAILVGGLILTHKSENVHSKQHVS